MRPSTGTGRPATTAQYTFSMSRRRKAAASLRRHPGGAGDHDHAGGVAVQPVHQARPVPAGAQASSMSVEMPGDAGAALSRQAGRLVQHDQVLVAIEHHRLQLAQHLGVGAAAGLAGVAPAGGGPGRRRDAHGLAGGKAGGGPGALAVHAQLAGAAQFLDHALGGAREMAAEPAVEADIGLVVGHGARGRCSCAAFLPSAWPSRPDVWPTSRSKPRSRGR